MSFGVLNIIPTFGQDVVAIYVQDDLGDDTQVLESANLIQASIDEHVTFFRQPLENGRTIIDHRIIEPVAITFQVILVDTTSIINKISAGAFNVSAKDVYGEIRQLFIDGTLLSIQTRTNVYPNQIIQAMPHEETSEMFNGVVLSFQSSEILFGAENISFSPADPTKADTTLRGKLNALAVSTTVAATLVAVAASIAGA